jgi:hypothetical protein
MVIFGKSAFRGPVGAGHRYSTDLGGFGPMEAAAFLNACRGLVARLKRTFETRSIDM